MVSTNSFTRKELLTWIKSGESSDRYVEKYLKHGSIGPRKAFPEEDYIPPPDEFKCPKSDKCVMDCYHKELHAYDERYCNDVKGECNTKCVHELISDCTFFEEDFRV